MVQFKQSSSRSIMSRKKPKTVSHQLHEEALAASERLVKLINVLEHHIDKLSQAVQSGKKTSLRESQTLAKTVLSLHKDLDRYRAILDLPISEGDADSIIFPSEEIETQNPGALPEALESLFDEPEENLQERSVCDNDFRKSVDVENVERHHIVSLNTSKAEAIEAEYRFSTRPRVPYYLSFRQSQIVKQDRPWQKVWARVCDSITRFQNTFPETNSHFVEPEPAAYFSPDTEKPLSLEWFDDPSPLQELEEKPAKLEWWQRVY